MFSHNNPYRFEEFRCQRQHANYKQSLAEALRWRVSAAQVCRKAFSRTAQIARER
jgi:hypothetical protein